MSTTLRDLRLYDKAHEKALQEQDYMNYLAGEYVFDAVMAAIGNVFAKKGEKQKGFIDVRPKPILSEAVKEELDAKQAYDNYLAQRMIDKLNWDLAHMDG